VIVPVEDPGPSVRWKIVALSAGLVLYCTGFFLPAVEDWGGWDCAWFALMRWHDDKVSSLHWFAECAKSVLVGVSGSTII
jgi:hypothetical protein